MLPVCKKCVLIIYTYSQTNMGRDAFRILLKGGGGGGQYSCFRGGGQALHAVHYNIYSKISRRANIQQGGGGANAPPHYKKTQISIGSLYCARPSNSSTLL